MLLRGALPLVESGAGKGQVTTQCGKKNEVLNEKLQRICAGQFSLWVEERVNNLQQLAILSTQHSHWDRSDFSGISGLHNRILQKGTLGRVKAAAVPLSVSSP